MDRKRLLRNPLIWILAAVLVYLDVQLLFDDTRGYTQVRRRSRSPRSTSGNVKDALIEDKEQRLRLTLDQPVDGSTKIITQYPAAVQRHDLRRRSRPRATSRPSTPRCTRSRS